MPAMDAEIGSINRIQARQDRHSIMDFVQIRTIVDFYAEAGRVLSGESADRR